mmetsp:Transcript_3726/g.15060  ORF Transcript_3726/g.15060 Transcript_3726/m.15060 type:complete len:259 (+) Transcript_3726:914-1690(+)
MRGTCSNCEDASACLYASSLASSSRARLRLRWGPAVASSELRAPSSSRQRRSAASALSAACAAGVTSAVRVLSTAAADMLSRKTLAAADSTRRCSSSAREGLTASPSRATGHTTDRTCTGSAQAASQTRRAATTASRRPAAISMSEQSARSLASAGAAQSRTAAASQCAAMLAHSLRVARDGSSIALASWVATLAASLSDLFWSRLARSAAFFVAELPMHVSRLLPPYPVPSTGSCGCAPPDAKPNIAAHMPLTSKGG